MKGDKIMLLYLIVCLMCICSTVSANTKFNWEIDLHLAHINTDLFSGNTVSEDKIKILFDELNKEERDQDRKSEESESSCSTTSTASSEEIIEGLEMVLDDFYQFPYRSEKQLKARKDFIATLHSVFTKEKIDPGILEKGVVMIAERLSA